MNADQIVENPDPTLRWTLLELARLEDDRAATEAASVPYWTPCPASVEAHRLAAKALRSAADRFLQLQPQAG